ncbi:MAG: hypothetical protein ACOC9H_00075 [Gemmatimonadota bacterium]
MPYTSRPHTTGRASGRPSAPRSGSRRPIAFWPVCVTAAVLVLAGCQDAPVAPDPSSQPNPTAAASSLVGVDLMPGEALARYRDAEREELVDGIVHTSFELRVGPGPFDVVRLHRVVREQTRGMGGAPARPARTHGSVFLAPGPALTFPAIFVDAGTEEPDAGTSLALFLADAGIDVWGMDFGWAGVPVETTDFTFMEEWGIEYDMRHLLSGISVARAIRAGTGQGRGTMHLLGYNYAGAVAYAAAAHETTLPPGRRQISGLIPVDLALRYSSSEEAALYAPCLAYAHLGGLLFDEDQPQFQSFQGLRLSSAAQRAINRPDETVPTGPLAGLTFHDAALYPHTHTFELAPREHWHMLAGVQDQDGVHLRFTDPARWFHLGASLPPYMPIRINYEYEAASCPDEGEVPWDDHLEDIRVPVLYLGAGGGFGTAGDRTALQTASRDVTLHTVSLDSEPTRDFGVADLMLADDAADLVWSTLLDWLLEH